jgi:hypothetical protein
MKKVTLLLCSCFFAAALQAQVVIHVPADYATIQEGIDAADPGDTVLVTDGTYYEQINFKGKAPLMVASNFLLDGNESHIANTIIDGSQLSNADSASVVYFVSGEDTTSILCGFTIQNGTGTYTPDNFEDRQGGGIYIADAGAKIIHNRITHNTLDDTEPVNGNSVAGAGICGKYAEGDYWVVIQDNTIDSNSCISKYEYAISGGIWTSYNCRISNNVIFGNKCTGILDANAQAGGIGGQKDISWNNSINISLDHNIISHNETQSSNSSASSGGVVFMNLTTIISDNEVSFNNVVTDCDTYGGGAAGLDLIDLGEGSVVKNNLITHNVSNCWGGGLHLEIFNILNPNIVLVENNYFLDNAAYRGGAISDIDHPAILQNNVFSGNTGTYGGACYLYQESTDADHLVTFINNSFSGNGADDGGGVCSYNASPLIFNCIFWQDGAFNGDEIFTFGGVAEIAWSNIDEDKIWGEWIAGDGLMFEPPLFNDNIYLEPLCESPCIDQGKPDYTCSHGETYYAPEYDINGEPRPLGAGFDLGAYESCVGVGIQSTVGSRQSAVSCYPNPTGGMVNFQLSVVDCQHVSLKIFDNLGREVATVMDELLPAGEHALQFDASELPAGAYFYRLRTEGIGQSSVVSHQPSGGKMIKF